MEEFPPVASAESGQKLLRFLQRRLDYPPSLLHRWIRTGQIRVNGKRCKPFLRIEAGDIVRVPPFALGGNSFGSSVDPPGLADAELEERLKARGLTLIKRIGDIWALRKAPGMAVQPGGAPGSVAERLAACFEGSAFKPAPAHRLDFHTGGVLLAGGSFEALKYLSEKFASGQIHKEYLAIVDGAWPWQDSRPLLNHLRLNAASGLMEVCEKADPGALEARCIACPIARVGERTLLQAALLTGRKHQLRIQFAHAGHPISGDNKYGGAARPSLFLHSFRIILPDGNEILSLPDWYAPKQPPPPLLEKELEKTLQG